MSDNDKNIFDESVEDDAAIESNDAADMNSAEDNSENVAESDTAHTPETDDEQYDDDEFSDDEFAEDYEYEESGEDDYHDGEENFDEDSDATELYEDNDEDNVGDYADDYLNEEDGDKRKDTKGIKYFIASIFLKLHNVERKKLIRNISVVSCILFILILIMTDIIPILPNSYHRSYVGNRFTLGETRNCDYDKLGNNILYVGGGSLCVFGPDMNLEYKKEIHTGIPVAKTNSDKAVVYFKNTGEYIIVNNGEVKEYTVDERICSAYITEDGYYSIVTDAVAGHNACVTVYSPDGEFVYEWFTNYDVLDSVVTFSGTNMVASVVEVTETGVSGKLVFFDMTKSEPIAELTLEDEIIFEMQSTENGKIIAIGESKTIAYTFSGKKIWQIDYDDRNLKTYDVSDDGMLAYVFDRYSSAQSESLVEVYDFSGRLSGAYVSEKNVKTVSANNSHCLLTLEDGTILLNGKCREKKEKYLNMNFEKAILYENYNFGFVIHDGVSETVSVCH